MKHKQGLKTGAELVKRELKIDSTFNLHQTAMITSSLERALFES